MSPIKPENRHLYPPRKEWLAIRAEVLDREGNKCQRCGVANYALGYRDEDGHWVDLTPDVKVGPDGRPPEGVTRIVLTISHQDHDPRNNGTPGNRPNLEPLCQRCHLKHDQALHVANGRKTRNARRGQVDLLEGGSA